MKVDVRGDCADLRAEPSDFISEHTGCGNLDGVVPIVVVVAQGVGEIEDGHLAYVARILSHVEVSRLYAALGDGVRHEEEVEFSIYHFALFHETLVNVGALRRVVNKLLSVIGLRLLEEPLSDALVHNNQRDFGSFERVAPLISIDSVLLFDDSVKLF